MNGPFRFIKRPVPFRFIKRQREVFFGAYRTVSQKVHTAVAGEQFDTAYQVHELPSIDTVPQSSEVLVNVTLLARIEALEAENASLKLLHKVNHF